MNAQRFKMRNASARRALVAALGTKYLWWDAIAGVHDERRVLAQIMDLGTYDDIRRLEAVTSGDELADVLRQAEPGWFSDRSWAFWKGRLAVQAGCHVPEHAPRRTFGDAGVL